MQEVWTAANQKGTVKAGVPLFAQEVVGTVG
jgi:hypothetical protein